MSLLQEEDAMSGFEPYHVVIVKKLKELRPDEPHFLSKLGAFVEIAQITQVPREHRDAVRNVIKDLTNMVREKKLVPSEFFSVDEMCCELVVIAMNHQDRADEEAKVA